MPIARDKRRAALVSVEEAAEILGQSRSSLYRAIERDDIPVPVFTIKRAVQDRPALARAAHRR